MTDLRECCQDDGNLAAPEQLDEGLVVRVCQECGAKHYELDGDLFDLVSEVTDA